MRILTFALFFAFVATAFSAPIDDYYSQYCKNSTLVTSLNTFDRGVARAGIVGVGLDLNAYGSAKDGQKMNSVAKSQAGAYLILLIILGLIIILSVFAFLGFCCCCDRVTVPNDSRAKTFVSCGVILLVVFVALFITTIVYLGFMQSNYNDSMCSIVRMPYETINGVGLQNGNRFIGLSLISQVFGNFTAYASWIPQSYSSFVNIFNRNLPSLTATAIQSLINFNLAFNGSVTSNGNATMTAPISVKTLTPFVNQNLQNEFQMFDTAANKISIATQSGMTLGAAAANEATWSSANALLTNVISQMNTTRAYFADTVAPGFVTVAKVFQNTPTGYWITLGLGFCLIALVIVIVGTVFRMSSTKTDSFRVGAKACLIFLCLIGFCLCILSIFMFISSVGIATVCKNLPLVLNSNKVSIGSLINSWGFAMTDTLNSSLTTCIAADANGQLSGFYSSLNSSIPATVLEYIDGFVAFKNILSLVANGSTTSPAIQSTVNIWSNYQTSYWADQPTAVTVLSQLNQQVSCSTISYALNPQNCTKSGCIGIYQTPSPSIPSCAPTSANQLYTNLKQFTSDEFVLLSNMISNLNSTGAVTPNSQQAVYRMAFYQAIPDYNQFVSTSGFFLSPLPTMTGGFLENANCTFLRTEALVFEEKVCFNYNNSLYYFTVMLAICTLLTLLISWSLCLGLVTVGERVESLVGTLPMDAKDELRQQDKLRIVDDANPIH